MMRDLRYRISLLAFSKGFTLIEVMIALAITAALLVTILYTLNHHLNIAERQENLTIATTLAKMKIREMEKDPVTSKGYFERPFSGYYYETEIRRSSFPSMVEIAVTVRTGMESVRVAEVIQSNAGK